MSDEVKPQETKTDMIAVAKGLPPTEVFSLKPRTFEEAFRFANLIAESTLIPKEFQKSPANVLIAVQLGMELGVAPMQALQNIAVINGRPTIWGDLVPAIVYQSGLCEQFDEIGDDKQATCTVKRKGYPPVTRKFTMAEAQRAGLAEKQTYKQYPARMLQMRARGYAVRDAFPDVLKGVHLREEMEDLEPRDVTPPLQTPKAIEREKKEDARSPSDTSDGKTVAPSTQNVSKKREKATRTDSQTATPETPSEQAEKSQEDIIKELIFWAENCPEEELLQETNNYLFGELKKVKGTMAQMQVLKPFNDRRQALAKEAKGA